MHICVCSSVLSRTSSVSMAISSRCAAALVLLASKKLAPVRARPAVRRRVPALKSRAGQPTKLRYWKEDRRAGVWPSQDIRFISRLLCTKQCKHPFCLGTPPAPCIAHSITRSCVSLRPPALLCIPYNIGDGNIVQRPSGGEEGHGCVGSWMRSGGAWLRQRLGGGEPCGGEWGRGNVRKRALVALEAGRRTAVMGETVSPDEGALRLGRGRACGGRGGRGCVSGGRVSPEQCSCSSSSCLARALRPLQLRPARG